MKKNETRGIRWGELLQPIQTRAAEEGTTVAEIAKRAVRKYLGVQVEGLKISANYREQGVGDTWGNVRWGKLAEALEQRAVQEGISSSALARRAMRLYLANGELPKVEAFRDELRHFGRQVAKIGGNLNQVAVHMNAEGTLKTTELGLAHDEMRTLFKELTALYKRMEKGFDKRIP